MSFVHTSLTDSAPSRLSPMVDLRRIHHASKARSPSPPRRFGYFGYSGTYVVFRKLHTRVAAYRQYLRVAGARRGAR